MRFLAENVSMVVWRRGFDAPVATSWPYATHGGVWAIGLSSKARYGSIGRW
jgi:hypothetical protein